MTTLSYSTPQSRGNVITTGSLEDCWYRLIQEIGLPVDTDGEIVDSIEKLQAQQSTGNIGTACFTENTPNYRTNLVWYAIVTK